MRPLPLLIGALATAGALFAGIGVSAADTAARPSTVIGGETSAAAAAELRADPPVRAEVTHKAWQQKKGSWCAPASVQLSLRTFGVKVTQDTLAAKMDTDDVGTTGADMRRVYNAYLEPEGYQQTWADATDPDVLMDSVAHNVGVLGKAAPLGIWGTKAPWIQSESEFGHVVSVRGYDRAAGTVTVWDPSANSYGGHHVVDVDKLAGASQKNGLSLINRA